jgi:hypothetical protein
MTDFNPRALAVWLLALSLGVAISEAATGIHHPDVFGGSLALALSIFYSLL